MKRRRIPILRLLMPSISIVALIAEILPEFAAKSIVVPALVLIALLGIIDFVKGTRPRRKYQPPPRTIQN